MARVELPDDQWAELRETKDVTERGRRPVAQAQAGVSEETFDILQSIPDEEMTLLTTTEKQPSKETQKKLKGIPAEDLERLNASNDHLIVAMVREWSYPNPLTVDGVLDLPGPAYTALRAAVAPAVKTMWVNFRPSTAADAPFGPSATSNGHSAAEPSVVEAPSPTSGEPISSSVSVLP